MEIILWQHYIILEHQPTNQPTSNQLAFLIIFVQEKKINLHRTYFQDDNPGVPDPRRRLDGRSRRHRHLRPRPPLAFLRPHGRLILRVGLHGHWGGVGDDGGG